MLYVALALLVSQTLVSSLFFFYKSTIFSHSCVFTIAIQHYLFDELQTVCLVRFMFAQQSSNIVKQINKTVITTRVLTINICFDSKQNLLQYWSVVLFLLLIDNCLINKAIKLIKSIWIHYCMKATSLTINQVQIQIENCVFVLWLKTRKQFIKFFLRKLF